MAVFYPKPLRRQSMSIPLTSRGRSRGGSRLDPGESRRLLVPIFSAYWSLGEEHNWLVVWNINFISPYIGNNHPKWLSYFSEGFKPPTSDILLPESLLHDRKSVNRPSPEVECNHQHFTVMALNYRMNNSRWRIRRFPRGTPSHHPFLDGIFHEINHHFWASPIWGNP